MGFKSNFKTEHLDTESDIKSVKTEDSFETKR